MKGLSFLNVPALYIEIGQSSIKMLDGDDGLELSLERLENGRLSPVCVDRLVSSIKVFLQTRNRGARPKAFCAISGRGVSLRRLELPPASREELQRLLALQLEREFPVHPDELAWGWQALKKKQSGAKTVQQVLVAAVKKETLHDYASLLGACGVSPSFTLSAVARPALLGASLPGKHAIIDLGRNASEVTFYEEGVPTGIRVLPWGGETLTQAIQKKLGISHGEAEKIKIDGRSHVNGNGVESTAQSAVDSELNLLASAVRTQWTGNRLYLCGETTRLDGFPERLTRAAGGGMECGLIRTPTGEGRSAAILGLKKECESNESGPALVFQTKVATERENAERPTQWKWPAIAALLLLGLLSTRYVEAWLQTPRLVRRIAELKAYREKLPSVDRDLMFLQYLKTNQPSYLDPVAVLANAAPQGTKLDSLALSRRGDLSLKASMRDFNQAVDFRSKIIGSGYFTNVVVEEQTPSADRQKMAVRITGQWNPSSEAKDLDSAKPARPGTAPRSIERNKPTIPPTNNVTSPKPAAPPETAPTGSKGISTKTREKE
ncbi:MAG TPA: pilus assembly protein PilM [Candidatus Saccharimonadales bacterium]|nr:pilus assembly protein PilM [Candidatus Saccharimonadales bacterium]